MVGVRRAPGCIECGAYGGIGCRVTYRLWGLGLKEMERWDCKEGEKSVVHPRKREDVRTKQGVLTRTSGLLL